MINDVTIRYVLTAVDQASARVQAANSKIMSSTQTTARAATAAGKASQAAAAEQVAAAKRVQAANAGMAASARRAAEANIALGNRMKSTGSTIAAAGHSMSRLTLPIVAIGAAAGKMSMDFEKAMEQVHTQAGASQKEVDTLRGKVLELAKAMPQGPNELAAGLYHIESVGLRGAKAMDALKVAAQGAAVGGADLEETATALGSAWMVNIKGAGDMHKTMGVLNAAVGAGNMRFGELVHALGTGLLPASKEAGLGLKDALGALAVFTDEGYQASSAAAQMSTAFHFLYNPTDKAAGALNAMGLHSSQLAADMHRPRGLLVALRDLKKHLEEAGGAGAKFATEKGPGGEIHLRAKNAAAVKEEQLLGQILPGGRGRIMLTLLNQLDRYEMKLNQVDKTSSRFGESVKKTQETAAYRVHAAWSSVQVAMIQLGDHILPAVVPAFEKIAAAIGHMGDAFSHLSPTLQTATLAFIAMGAALGPLMTMTGNFMKAGGAFVGVLGKMQKAILGTAAAEKELAAATATTTAVTEEQAVASGAAGAAGAEGAAAGGLGALMGRGKGVAGMRGFAARAVGRAPVAGAIALGGSLAASQIHNKTASSIVQMGSMGAGLGFMVGGPVGAAIGAGGGAIAGALMDPKARAAIGKALQAAGKQMATWARSAGKFFSGLGSSIVHALSGVGRAIMSVLRPIGSAIAAPFKAAFRVLAAVVRVGMAVLKPIVEVGFKVIRVVFLVYLALVLTAVKAWWTMISTIFKTGFSILSAVAKAGWSVVTAVFNAAKTAVIATVKAVVSAVSATWHAIISVLSGPAHLAWEAVKVYFKVAKTIVTTEIHAIIAVVKAVWGAFKTVIVGPVKSGLSAAWGAIRDATGPARHAMGSVISAIVGVVASLPGKIKNVLTGVGGVIGDIGHAIAQWLNDKTPLGDRIKISVLGKDIGFTLPSLRGGGEMDTALAAVSPGELAILPSGKQMMVPGAPTAADNVLAALPKGTAIITGHGQAMMAAGASLPDVLANQLPHFAAGGVLSPGEMASLAYKHGVRPRHEAVRMGAIGMRESHGNPKIHNYNPPIDDSWGLWQINVLPKANPRFKTWRLTDPDVNARAMAILHKAGGEKPWGGYPESSFSKWINDADKGFGKSVRLPGYKYVGLRALSRGQIDRARMLSPFGSPLQEGFDAASGGGALDSEWLGNLLNTAKVPIGKHSSSTIAALGSATGSKAGGTKKIDGHPVATWIAPIVQWAKKHGWHGSVGSGYRTAAEQQSAAQNYGLQHYGPGGAQGSNHRKTKYPGGAIDVSDPARLAQVLKNYPAKPNLVWGGPVMGDQVHFSATGHRRGGIVGFRKGGVINKLGSLAWMQQVWNRAAPFYGQPKSDLRDVFNKISTSSKNIFVGTAWGFKGNKVDYDTPPDLLWPKWLYQGKQKLDRIQLAQLLLHEIAHRFQDPQATNSDWKAEGGAEAKARIVTKRLYGRHGVTGSPYAGFVRKVVHGLGNNWINYSQFGRPIPKFQGGGILAGRGRGMTSLRGLTAAGSADNAGANRLLKVLFSVVQDASAATFGGLINMANRIRQQIRQFMKGGLTSRERAQTQRLRGALTAVTGALGERIGGRVARAATIGATGQQWQDVASRYWRRMGVDPSSTAGLGHAGEALGGSLTTQRQQMSQLRAGFRAAGRVGGKAGKSLQAQIKTQMQELAGNIDETITSIVENRRAQAQQAAQDVVDQAQHATNMAQGGQGWVQAMQRMTGVARVTTAEGNEIDNPDALRTQSAYIQGHVVTALQGQQTALNNQLAVAQNSGAGQGVVNGILEAIQSNQTDIMNAMADAADLIKQAAEAAKQAAEDAAQAVVDASVHGETMANYGLQNLELQQQLSGTFDSTEGAQARSDFIKNTILPAINAEITALQAQLKVANEQGDSKLATQIAEEIAGKQNDLLQAQLDAQNAIKENTDNLKDQQGSSAFDFGGQGFTDLIGVGVGA